MRRRPASVLAAVVLAVTAAVTAIGGAQPARAVVGWSVTVAPTQVEDTPIAISFSYHLSGMNDDCSTCGGVTASLKRMGSGVACPLGRDDSSDGILDDEADGTPADVTDTRTHSGVAAGSYLLCAYFRDSTGAEAQTASGVTVVPPPQSLRLGAPRTVRAGGGVTVALAFDAAPSGRDLEVRIVPGARCPADPLADAVRGELSSGTGASGVGRATLSLGGIDTPGTYAACGWLLRAGLVEASARPLALRVLAAPRG